MLRTVLFLLLPLGLSAQAVTVFGPEVTPVVYLPPSADSLVRWAAGDLADDLTILSGRPVAVVETEARDPGRPGIYVNLEETPRLDGRWETFSLRTAGQSLLISGSDARGTVYGIFEVAERLGISPWKWWADVTPVPVDSGTLTLPDTGYVAGPSVKYRGIFLNDEDWGLQPWAAATFEPETGDIGPKTYEKIFQLLLRLKANTIWPAMHPSTQAFFSIPGNREMAERYGIYVGSSHAEPMLRNNVDEWDRGAYGEYNYFNNADAVRRYWQQRLTETRNGNYLYTLGMRGIHDSGMEGDATVEEQVDIVETIIADQRRMLSQTLGRPADSIPQVFIPYKEVLELYDAGLEVPDDVTLMWTDDNYGYIRRLSEGAELGRSGGSGVYYHLSYWGRPHDYLWLSSVQPGLIWYELQRAYANGARQVWIANVGDIKPGEYAMELFLDLAWDVSSVNEATIPDHLAKWGEREFGADAGATIADLMQEYYRLAFLRKPEYMGWSQTEPTTATRPAEFTTANGNELQRRIDDYRQLYERSKQIAAAIPEVRRDAYFQLVDYPVRGAALLNATYGFAKHALLSTDAEERTRLRAAARTSHEEIGVLTRYYNTTLAGGKWSGMMDAAPRDLPVFELPDFREFDPAEFMVATAPDLPAPLTVRASDFGDQRAPAGYRWTTVPGLGYGGEALTLLPATTDRFVDDAPYVEYTFEIAAPGDYRIEIRCLPTHANDFDHVLRARFNGGELSAFHLNTRGRSEAWKQFVLGNHVPVHYPVRVETAGPQTLKLYVNQTGIVIDQISIAPADYPEYYEIRPATGE